MDISKLEPTTVVAGAGAAALLAYVFKSNKQINKLKHRLSDTEDELKHIGDKLKKLEENDITKNEKLRRLEAEMLELKKMISNDSNKVNNTVYQPKEYIQRPQIPNNAIEIRNIPLDTQTVELAVPSQDIDEENIQKLMS